MSLSQVLWSLWPDVALSLAVAFGSWLAYCAGHNHRAQAILHSFAGIETTVLKIVPTSEIKAAEHDLAPLVARYLPIVAKVVHLPYPVLDKALLTIFEDVAKAVPVPASPASERTSIS